MVHPETNSLLVLYDDAQSINRRKARLGFSFAEVGIQARGRTTILRMNYCNTAQGPLHGESTSTTRQALRS